jgi:hypothetical protein
VDEVVGHDRCAASPSEGRVPFWAERILRKRAESGCST